MFVITGNAGGKLELILAYYAVYGNQNHHLETQQSSLVTFALLNIL